MTESDATRWNARYRPAPPAALDERFPLAVFSAFEAHFPRRGLCLELACGQGRAAVWLARRGMEVHGVDISAVAIGQARELAARYGVAARCHFSVADLDGGLPALPAVDLLLCHHFRNPGLYAAMQQRLAPGGLLALATLSEVGASPGRFRSQPGELRRAFAALDILDQDERDGQAWLLGRAPGHRQISDTTHEDNLQRS